MRYSKRVANGSNTQYITQFRVSLNNFIFFLNKMQILPGCAYLLTYLLNLWSRVFLEKLTGLQLVKKFPAFYGTRWFITVSTSARSSIQSIIPHPSFPQVFPPKPCTPLSPPPNAYMPRPTHFIDFFTRTIVRKEYR
jgi:hypothetical protein